MPDGVSYTGELITPLETIDIDDLALEPERLAGCQGGWAHTHAKAMAIFEIVSGHHVKLIRRKRFHTANDGPGEVEGVVIGMSTDSNGIWLGFDNGYAVNVNDVGAWWWEVTDE